MAVLILIIEALIALGSVLVDPFGLDFADHPLGSFCDTIEAQVRATDERAKRCAPSLAYGRKPVADSAPFLGGALA